MKESVTYQAIVEEGELKALHKVLLQQGRKKFGPPSAADELALMSIADVDRLVYLSERLLDVASWQDLLAVP